MDHETIISIAASQVASVMQSASEWPYAGYTALALLLDVAVKGMLILGIAGLVAASLRRSSAAVRHFVWTVAAAALLALPILSLMVPRWRVPVPFEIAGWTMAPVAKPVVHVSRPMPAHQFHRRHPPYPVQPPQPPQPAMPPHAPHAPYPPRLVRPARPPRAQFQQFHPLPYAEVPGRVPPHVSRPRVRVIVVPDEAVTADEAIVGAPGAVSRDEVRRSEARMRRRGSGGAAAAIVGGRASSAARASREAARNMARRDLRDEAAFDPALVLLIVWIAGALGVAGGIVAGILRVERLKRNAVPVEHGWSVALLRRLCDEMGVTRPVMLLEGDADAMPMTWGILRPMVLLPSSASGWQEARLLAVLRHELAHVRRLDTLTQLMAEVACAVHWFNPVVWIMARRLRIEREMACDDAVLAAGSVASEYAAQLVALARSFRPVPATVFAAVTMATPSQLKGRVHALLDERRNRGRVAAGIVVTAWIAAVLLVVPLAAMTPVSRFEGAPAPGRSPRASARQWASAPPSVAPYAMLGAGPAGTYASTPNGGVSILELGGKAAYVLPVPRRLKGVVVAPRVFAAPRPAPFQQQALCWQSGAEAQRVSTRHNDTNGREDYRLTWQRGGCEVEIRLVGTVRFTRDFTDIASIANGGWMRVTEEDRGRVRRVNIEPSEGALAYDYTVDGEARPFDAAAREWLRATLVQFFRATGYAADERAAWILSEQGMTGLMREIDLLRGDHARRRYYQAGIAAGGRNEGQTAELLLRASRQISSDYELAQLLVETSDDIPFTSATRDAFIAASRTLESDYERRRVLSAVLESAKLDVPSTAAMLESAGELSSDYEKAELLIGLTKRYTLEPSLRVQYLRTASGIESDYEKRRVFEAIVAQGALAPQDLAELLNASVTIESDYEAATLLMALSRYDLSSPALQEAYLKAANSLESDYEHRRVLSSIARREQIAPEVLSVVLRSARSIESDYELAELLTQIARTQTLTSALRDEFMRTLQTIESTHEYDRVTGVLSRAEQQRRGAQSR